MLRTEKITVYTFCLCSEYVYANLRTRFFFMFNFNLVNSSRHHKIKLNPYRPYSLISRIYLLFKFVHQDFISSLWQCFCIFVITFSFSLILFLNTVIRFFTFSSSSITFFLSRNLRTKCNFTAFFL